MAEDLGINELFPELAPAPPPPVEPEPAPAPDPLQMVSERLARLEGVLSHMVSYPPAPPMPPPPVETVKPGTWEETSFLTPADAAELMQAPDPTAVLNKVFNRVGKGVYEPLAAQLTERDKTIAELRREGDQKLMLVERNRLAQANVEQFYVRHPDVQPFAELVPLEAQRIAYEASENPGLFAGKGVPEVHQLLAERVRAKVQGWTKTASEGTGETVTTAAPAPARRTFMERGSGVRPTPAAASKDPNARALADMSRHIRAERK